MTWQEDMVVSSKREWSGRQGHSGNFVGTGTMVHSNQVTSSALRRGSRTFTAMALQMGQEPASVPTGTTLLSQERNSLKTFL